MQCNAMQCNGHEPACGRHGHGAMCVCVCVHTLYSQQDRYIIVRVVLSEVLTNNIEMSLYCYFHP